MTGDQAAQTRLSVRGQARLTVAPDAVRLAGVVSAVRGSKSDAVGVAAGALDQLTSALAARGGRPLRLGEERHALTWSAYAATTSPEHEHDERTGRYGPTGRVRADVSLMVTVRDLDRLTEIDELLTSVEALAVHDVSWTVDADNPAWPQVRAAAIDDALRKGRDYAVALGGAVTHVEHVADAGLLGGGGDSGYGFAVQQSAARAAFRGADEGGVPSLDPVPQELVAVVEARFVAGGVSAVGPGPP